MKLGKGTVIKSETFEHFYTIDEINYDLQMISYRSHYSGLQYMSHYNEMFYGWCYVVMNMPPCLCSRYKLTQ